MLLEVEGLEVLYGHVTAVTGVSLAVSAGEIVTLLGPNGAGKTSTVRALSGLVPKAAGTVTFDGADISGWPAWRIARAGLVQVPEGRRLFAPLSVEENLLLGACGRKDRQKVGETLTEIYDTFAVLRERRRQKAGLLSGGEQQMVAVGRALMAGPKAILLDEPSMGLAPVMVQVIMPMIAQIAERGIGILMVEQNAAAALAIGHRGVLLQRGSVVLADTCERLSQSSAIQATFLGEQLA